MNECLNCGRQTRNQWYLDSNVNLVSLCIECVRAYYFICNSCAVRVTGNPDKQCKFCANKTFICEGCNQEKPQSRQKIDKPKVCIDCLPKYGRCKKCVAWAKAVDLIDYGGYIYCHKCHDKIVYPPLTEKRAYAPERLSTHGNSYSKVAAIHFGVEIECIQKHSKSTSKGIVDKFPRWGWCRDGSIGVAEEEFPVEFLSPPLIGDNGIEEVKQFVTTIKDNGFKVNKTCGFHIHIDANNMKWHNVRNVTVAWMHIQPYIFDQFPERKSVRYCLPINYNLYDLNKCRDEKDFFQLIYGIEYSLENLRRKKSHKYDGARYKDFNLHAYYYKKTLEFRLFPGTLNAQDICDWVEVVTVLSDRAQVTNEWSQQSVFDLFTKRIKRKFKLKPGEHPSPVNIPPPVDEYKSAIEKARKAFTVLSSGGATYVIEETHDEGEYPDDRF